MALYAAPRIRWARGPFGRRRQRLRMRDEYREKFRVLGLKIAYYRKLRGLTQEQLAEAIGRSVSFVSQVEANNSSRVKGVSLETLFLIAERLDIPASKLFEE